MAKKPSTPRFNFQVSTGTRYNLIEPALILVKHWLKRWPPDYGGFMKPKRTDSLRFLAKKSQSPFKSPFQQVVLRRLTDWPRKFFKNVASHVD